MVLQATLYTWGRDLCTRQGLPTAPVLKSLLEKSCSSLKALSTDTSFIKFGVCQQKLSTLEFNFHYRLSSHCVNGNLPMRITFIVLTTEIWLWESATNNNHRDNKVGENYIHLDQSWVEIEHYFVVHFNHFSGFSVGCCIKRRLSVMYQLEFGK